MTTVFKLFSDATADLNAIVEGHRQITQIEKVVQVGAQQKPVANFVRPILGVGADVTSLKGREGLLSRNGTPARIRIGDFHAKSALAQSWPYGDRRSVSIRALGDSSGQW